MTKKRLPYRDSAYLDGSAMVRLAGHFDDLATGRTQVPMQPVSTRIRERISDPEVLAYHDRLVPKTGPLFAHFLASVPCILEEMSRLGVALTRLSQRRAKANDRIFTFYEVDAFDGSNGRTLADHANGRIKTFTNSPNQANEVHFEKFANHALSKFHSASFLNVGEKLFSENPSLAEFQDGFDYIYETVAFQFYGKDRVDQIGHIAQLLKDDGLIFFLEKLGHPSIEEYERRERAKDELHKSHYFTAEEIEWKRQQMLSQMQNGQVNFSELIEAIQVHFRYIYLIWNSTNFYEFVASNSKKNVEDFISLLGEPNVPGEFVFEEFSVPKAVNTDVRLSAKA